MLESKTEPPDVRVPPPGPNSRAWSARHRAQAAPMGPKAPNGQPFDSVVFERGRASNVYCVDGNRYVDFAAGFGALLLGHAHPELEKVLSEQSTELWQALGDVSPSTKKIELLEKLTRLHPSGDATGLLGLSGADAITAALKTALLATGRPGVLAFSGSYHGLSYGPLAHSDLRQSYRTPFLAQLSPHVRVAPYPEGDGEESLERARALIDDNVGAVLIEPILGRGGVVVPPAGYLSALFELAHSRGALVIADEIWTGLGRSGAWLSCVHDGALPDLICLGKGLGGGLPVSACLGPKRLMENWSRPDEVVHTSTFAGAPLSAAVALRTLEILERDRLPEESLRKGGRLIKRLEPLTEEFPGLKLRGRGLMVGLEIGLAAGGASGLRQHLLARGFMTTTGGGQRDVLVLTPPLTIEEEHLDALAEALRDALQKRQGAR
jgi:4-aminobutyrate aminotransferase-like enzyme